MQRSPMRLTNKDTIAIGWISVIVFVQVSWQSPDHNRVDNEDVSYMFVKDYVFQDKPVKHTAQTKRGL